MNEVIRVQAYHYKGVIQRGPEFELNLSEGREISAVEDKETVTITSGALSLVIAKEEFSMTFYRNGKKISESKGNDLAYMKTDWKGLAYDKGGEDAYMRQQLSLSVGELVYGTGERFTAFVKNGQTVDIWNEDGGTSTEQSYKNIPFYLTNQGYGVLINHPEKVSLEIGSEQVSKVQFSVPGESLDYFFINGPTMKEVLSRYTSLTGKPALPAPWTFGLWLSTSFTTNYDEETVMSFVDGMLERDIPLRVFHFDCFWMKEFHWSDFVWDSRVFANPELMLKRIHDKNLKICVWINPYIGQESILFDEGMKKGYFLKKTNGDVWQWDMWQPGMAIVDFTNKEATKWFQEKLSVLLDMGVDCFKTDFGERIPVDVVYSDGSDPAKMHNYYTYLYNEAVFTLLQEKKGEKDAVLFARSATVGGQKFPVHWGGDCWSDYVSMEESLRGGLSLTMSGFGYWSHDIGGFESTSTPDVYKRWAAFGLFSSHSRLHGSTSYRVPWLYDEEAVDVVRTFSKQKSLMMPYLWKNAIETSQTGIPMMRSMVLEFPQDHNCSYLDKQYMFGDSLLVAPIFNEESKAIFYLPKGDWTHFLSGEIKEGGTWYEEECDYQSIPVFAKENSIIVTGSCDNKPDYDYADNAKVTLYEIKEKAETQIFNMSEQEELYMVAEAISGGLRIRAKACKPYTIILKNKKVSQVTNGEFKIEGNDTIIIPKLNDQEIICTW